MPCDDLILGLPEYQITNVEKGHDRLVVWARYTGPIACPHCQSGHLRKKDRYTRKVRHESWGLRPTVLHLEARKFLCLSCGHYFNQRFPGILPRKRSTEPFRRQIFRLHFDGICRKTLAAHQCIGTATVERWFQDFLGRETAKLSGRCCPQMLGIDEHFFTRRRGYATTLCDLKGHRVYDVVLGRSQAALDACFRRLPGKEHVQLVCIDLASSYRALVRKHFPNAKIVADRFHVIRLINHHFLATWRELDPIGSKNRGLLSLMRRHHDRLSLEQKHRLEAYFRDHPEIEAVYTFKQKLTDLLREKTCQAHKCRKLIPVLLDYIQQLKTCGIEPLEQLGRTLASWSGEIPAMWRFTKNNGITEGFHNKMEMISRRAFGFRNFENYRLRVKAMCA